jgi:DNA-binding HxlR family transcriptional regulator
VVGILKLIGSGAGGEVLMALGPRPLRTEKLARRLPHVSERSVYRYAGELTKCQIVNRHEEPGVPSTVVLSLTDAGRQLYRLLRRFAATSGARLPGPGSPVQSWSSLSLLGQLWETGFAETLSREPQTLTQLAGRPHDLTFHQVTRRMRLFSDSGLVRADPPTGHGRRYELTEHGRRRMALIAGIGRWRQRHVITDEPTGLTGPEMATVIRAAVPLILLPEFSGQAINLGVANPVDDYGHRTTESLQGVVGSSGKVRCNQAPRPANASAVGTINTWLAVLLDGNRGRMRTGGNLRLVDACLTGLHERLWETDGTAS